MEQIKEKVIDYIEHKLPNFKKTKTSFTCPKCSKVIATLVPNTYKVFCPICKIIGNIYNVVRLLETDKENSSDGEIQDYIKALFNLDIITDYEKEKSLNLYEKLEFDLVPIVKDGKAPIEKAWTTKHHKDKNEWYDWLKNGLNIGVKTGQISNILVLDVDVKTPPSIVAKYLNKTLVQYTSRGYHLFFKYDSDFKKGDLRSKGYEIDIETDGGQVVLFPSVVGGEKRNINFREIIEIPKELKDWLKSHISKKPLPNYSIEREKGIIDNSFSCDLIKEGTRNNVLMHLGGILRKQLNIQDTSFVLDLINKRLCSPSLSRQEFNNIVSSISRYTEFDLTDIAIKILEYIRLVEEVSATDIVSSLGFERKIVDKALSDLVREEYIIRKGKIYMPINKAEWRDTFIEVGKPVDFKMPYFDHVAIFRTGDMVIIGGKAGSGKTHLAMNFVKKLVEQGKKPYYISLESGSRFVNIALALGLKEGDFYWCSHFNPETIELEKDAITIIDWLLPPDYASSDKLYQRFSNQLVKKGGLLIIFVQLRENESYFATDMLKMFPALVAKFLYTDETGLFSKFEISKIRESKGHLKSFSIPLVYDYTTKEVNLAGEDNITFNEEERS